MRVWLGIQTFLSSEPEIVWRFNKNGCTPKKIQPLSCQKTQNGFFYFGEFEFPKPDGDAESSLIEVSAGQESTKLKVRKFPSEIPSEQWFNILLCSCYHQAEDRQALVSQAFLNLPSIKRPDLSLFMGDQVYLDLPTLNNYPNDEAKLALRFHKYYLTNWTTYVGLDAVLKAAPSVFCPDDHEYWNNFPHRSPIIQNSWKADSRQRWKNAADTLFDKFQLCVPAARGDCTEIDIDPFSIIVLDQRTQRMSDRSSALGPNGLKQLEDWVDRVISGDKYGAVVTGQSLLDKSVGEFQGAVADWMLANYDDYESVIRSLKRLSDAGKPVLLLTGDVHWGRVTKIHEAGRTRFIEVICSPASLVTTVGSDQLKTIGAGFRHFFKGEKDRWPRHSSAPDAEPFFAQHIFGKRFQTKTIYKHKGDQFAMLGLRKSGYALQASVTYYEVHKTPKEPRVVKLGLLS